MALKEIPGSAGFLADEDGNIYSPDGEIRKTYRNGDGYLTASVKLVDGRWITFGIQRLVALAHIPNDIPLRDQVNHLDMDIENNCVKNLEWVTCNENVIHSIVMRKDNQYPTVTARDVRGVVGIYRNAFEASEKLGVTPLEVWLSIKDETVINGMLFNHRPLFGNIPESVKKKTIPLRNPDGTAPARSIKTLDIDTGDLAYFDTMTEAAKFYNTSPSHLYQSIAKSSKPRFFKKKYQVAYAEEDFQEITADDLLRAKNHGAREVIAYSSLNKSYVIYPSAKEFIAEHKLSKKAVTKALAEGRLRNIGGWVATYLTGENLTKLQEFIGNPVPQ